MTELLLHIIALSVSACVLIGLVAGLRRVFGGRLSCAWQYYIWLLVIARLLIPFSFYGGMTGRLFDAARNMQTGRYIADMSVSDRGTGGHVSEEPDSAGGGKAVLYGAAGYEEAEKEAAASAEITDYNAVHTDGEKAAPAADAKAASIQAFSLGRKQARSLIWLVWLLPAAVGLIGRLVSLNRFLHRLRKERKSVEAPALLEANQRISQEMGLKKPLPMYASALAVTPMLTGFFRPFLVFPEDYGEGKEAESADYILRHELTHYKRKDLAYKWLVQAAVCLHWFNPLVRWMAGKTEGDCELSCDEAVLARLAPAQRLLYGDVLINSLRSGGTKRIAASVSLCEDARLVKERLYSIMRYDESKKRTGAVVLTIVVTAAVFLAGGITSLAKGHASEVKNVSAADGAAVTAGITNTKDNAAQEPATWGDRAEMHPWTGTFTCSSYFNNQFYIQLAWNNAPSNYKTARTVDTGSGEYQVAFYEGTEALADNAVFMEALKASLIEQKQDEGSGNEFWTRNNRLLQPVVYFVQGPFQETAGELAVKAYNEDDMGFFSVVYDKADAKTQEALMEEAYRNLNFSVFSIGINGLSVDNRIAIAERAYEDDELALFSIAAGTLSGDDLKELRSRAKKDGRLVYYNIMQED